MLMIKRQTSQNVGKSKADERVLGWIVSWMVQQLGATVMLRVNLASVGESEGLWVN